MAHRRESDDHKHAWARANCGVHAHMITLQRPQTYGQLYTFQKQQYYASADYLIDKRASVDVQPKDFAAQKSGLGGYGWPLTEATANPLPTNTIPIGSPLGNHIRTAREFQCMQRMSLARFGEATEHMSQLGRTKGNQPQSVWTIQLHTTNGKIRRGMRGASAHITCGKSAEHAKRICTPHASRGGALANHGEAYPRKH